MLLTDLVTLFGVLEVSFILEVLRAAWANKLQDFKDLFHVAMNLHRLVSARALDAFDGGPASPAALPLVAVLTIEAIALWAFQGPGCNDVSAQATHEKVNCVLQGTLRVNFRRRRVHIILSV